MLCSGADGEMINQTDVCLFAYCKKPEPSYIINCDHLIRFFPFDNRQQQSDQSAAIIKHTHTHTHSPTHIQTHSLTHTHTETGDKKK